MMKRTFGIKMLVLLLAALTCLCTLASCNGGDSSDPGESTSGSTGETMEPVEKMDLSDMDLSPYITLGQYKNVPVSVEEIEYVVALRELLLEDGAYFEKITEGDRAVEEGDIINVNYTGYHNGKEFEGGKASNQDITVYDGMGYIDGFATGFIGTKVGETSSFDVTFPENYQEASLAGEEVTFEFKVNFVYEFDEITDEIADDLSSGLYPTAEAFEEHQRSLIVQEQLWATIVGNSTVKKYPEQQVQYYYQQNRNYYEFYAASYGIEYETFLGYFGMTDADLYESAELYVLEDLVYYAIRNAEDIVLTEEEYEKEIGTYIDRYKNDLGYTDEEIEDSMAAIEDNMLYDKVQRTLVSWAKITWEEREELPEDESSAGDSEAVGEETSGEPSDESAEPTEAA